MDKKKKVLIGLGIVILLIVIVGVSFAWWTNTATQESLNKISSDCLKLEIEDVNNSAINLEKAYPITDVEATSLSPYTFKITNVCNNNTEYTVQLEIMDMGDKQLSSQYLAMDFNGEGKKLVTDYQNVEPTYKKSDYTANEARALTSGFLNPKESVTYSLKIWIDESVTINDPVMNKEFIGKISVTSSLTQLTDYKFSEFIKNRSEIEKIEHEATEQTGLNASIDYRYTGKNPNNYVYFGCEDNCTEDNLYRIIGVIPTQNSESGQYEERVKLIKANYYTENESGQLLTTDASQPAPGGYGYQWNSSVSNKWEESTLQSEVLNKVYWNSLGAYQNYIEKVKWYLGAPSYNDKSTYTSEQLYNTERSNIPGKSNGATSFIGNIGLMYLSDYAYSIESGHSEESVFNNAAIYKTSAWLYNLENKYYEWTMNPNSMHENITAWLLEPLGRINCHFVATPVYVWGIRPTFYLKNEVQYKSGSGSIDNPYRVKMNLNDYLIAKSSTDTSIEKIEHQETEQTPSLTDYRFVGSNPNNYAYFGCESNCTEDNLYRIIGVISTKNEYRQYESRVKLIKAKYYNETSSGLLLPTDANYPAGGGTGKGYQWDNKANNNWGESALQKQVLNGVYWNSLGEYQKYIAPAVWYLGAPIYSEKESYTPDQFYNIERSNTQGYSGGATNMTTNIGLMYPSDYAYSIGSGHRGESIHNNATIYKNEAWLYNLENKYYEWTMIPERVSSVVSAWSLYPNGSIFTGNGYHSSLIWGIRPVFYLKSDIQYKSGNGSINNPYRFAL